MLVIIIQGAGVDMVEDKNRISFLRLGTRGLVEEKEFRSLFLHASSTHGHKECYDEEDSKAEISLSGWNRVSLWVPIILSELNTCQKSVWRFCM